MAPRWDDRGRHNRVQAPVTMKRAGGDPRSLSYRIAMIPPSPALVRC